MVPLPHSALPAGRGRDSEPLCLHEALNIAHSSHAAPAAGAARNLSMASYSAGGQRVLARMNGMSPHQRSCASARTNCSSARSPSPCGRRWQYVVINHIYREDGNRQQQKSVAAGWCCDAAPRRVRCTHPSFKHWCQASTSLRSLSPCAHPRPLHRRKRRVCL